MTVPIPADTNGINTYNEKSLHAALKQWYAQADDHLEVKVDGFVIDLVRGDLLVEIQTGSFSPLKRKLHKLAETHPVRLVYPIPMEKWIVNLPQDGMEPPKRRKSPRRGKVEHVFSELVYIPALLEHQNFSLEVLLIREEESRRFDGKKGWRRKGWVTAERALIEVVERHVFETPQELARLFPANLPDPFTVRQVAKAASQPVWLARKMIYVFKALGLISATGKKGRAITYSRINS